MRMGGLLFQLTQVIVYWEIGIYLVPLTVRQQPTVHWRNQLSRKHANSGIDGVHHNQ